MVLLRIPKQHQAAIMHIIHIQDDELGQIQNILESVEPTAEFSNLLERIKALASKEQLKLDDPVFEVILSLYWVRARLDIPLSKFADLVSKAVEERVDEDFEVGQDGAEKLRERLAQLLNVNSIGLASKGSDLQTEYKKIFLDARILTDIRPIFGADVNEPPVGSVMTHTLKICYDLDGDFNEFFVALDNKDINKLIEILNRAKDKANTLKSEGMLPKHLEIME